MMKKDRIKWKACATFLLYNKYKRESEAGKSEGKEDETAPWNSTATEERKPGGAEVSGNLQEQTSPKLSIRLSAGCLD